MATEGFNISPQIFTGAWTIMVYIALGVLGTAVILYLLYRLWERFTYTIHITVYKKAGNATIKEEDWAKKFIDQGGNYRFHYRALNRRSPIIDDKYLNFIRKKWLFFFQKSYQNYDVFYTNGAIYPLTVKTYYEKDKERIVLEGIDYDTYNFIQQEVKTLQIKHQRIDRLMGILPYVGLLLVVVAFVVGTALNNQHIEKMTEIWLNSAKTAAQNIIDKVAGTQIIPQQ